MPIFPVAPVEGLADLSLDDVKAHLFGEDHATSPGTVHDAALSDLLQAAVPVIEGLCGPIDARTVTETHYATRGPIVLREHPVLSVTSVTPYGGTAYESDTYDLNGAAGILTPHSYWSGTVTVTYLAGRSNLPYNVKRALLRWISWSWSRDHGGSETYMPPGEDAVAGLGVAGIEKELRHILADEAQGAVIA